jgi:hypothetical protein
MHTGINILITHNFKHLISGITTNTVTDITQVTASTFKWTEPVFI